jgi:hypothetical protein
VAFLILAPRNELGLLFPHKNAAYIHYADAVLTVSDYACQVEYGNALRAGIIAKCVIFESMCAHDVCTAPIKSK